MERKGEDKSGGGTSIPLGTNDIVVGKLMNGNTRQEVIRVELN
jgi:hypothetical protein